MIKIEKRRTPALSTSILVGVVAVILALLISGIVLKIMGYDPIKVFGVSFSKTFLTLNGILENFVMLVPLSLCALSVAIAAKAGLWNIGVEGQFYAGAIAATGVAMLMPNAPGIVIIPVMIITGALTAGLLCYISVLPKIYFNISEILTTILLNSVVLLFVRWLVYGPWKDPSTMAAQTTPIADTAKLPILVDGSRLHLGVIIAIAIIVICHFYLKNTVSGFELRMVGENAKGARYSGVNLKKYFFIAMLFSGVLSGIAGSLEISGVVHRLQPTIAGDYGFSAFAVAWVARLNVYAIAIISYLFSGLLVAGYKMQMMSLPYSITGMMKGLILILVLGGEFFAYYKISFVKKAQEMLKSQENTDEIPAAETLESKEA